MLSYERIVSFVRKLSTGGRNKTVVNKLISILIFLRSANTVDQ